MIIVIRLQYLRLSLRDMLEKKDGWKLDLLVALCTLNKNNDINLVLNQSKYQSENYWYLRYPTFGIWKSREKERNHLLPDVETGCVHANVDGLCGPQTPFVHVKRLLVSPLGNVNPTVLHISVWAVPPVDDDCKPAVFVTDVVGQAKTKEWHLFTNKP